MEKRNMDIEYELSVTLLKPKHMEYNWKKQWNRQINAGSLDSHMYQSKWWPRIHHLAKLTYRFPYRHQGPYHMAGSFLWHWNRKRSKIERLCQSRKWKLLLLRKLPFSRLSKREDYCKPTRTWCGRHSLLSPPASSFQRSRKTAWER